jgi:hypothetical protein
LEQSIFHLYLEIGNTEESAIFFAAYNYGLRQSLGGYLSAEKLRALQLVST